MALVLLIALSFAAAVVFVRYPVQLIGASFVLWGMIPYAGADEVTGIKIGPHPGTLLALATFIVQIAVRPRSLGQAFVRRFPFFLAVSMVYIAAVCTTLAAPKRLGGFVKATDQIFVPLLAFWLISAVALTAPDIVKVIRNTIVFVALGESVLALIQYVADKVIFWHSAYATRYWFKANYHRWMGATDHPLVLATLIGCAIPLLCFMRGWPQLVSMLVMVSAVVVTQSRTGIVAAAVGAIFVILTSQASSARKVLTVGALVIGGAGLATSSLAVGLQDRIANDAGSAAARTTALDYFSTHWTDTVFAGGGIDSSFRLANAVGLRSSFENAFVMYAIDIGVIFALVYLFALAGLAILSARRDRSGAWFSTLVLIVISMTFSSLEVETLLGPLLFLLLAVAANSVPKLNWRGRHGVRRDRPMPISAMPRRLPVGV